MCATALFNASLRSCQRATAQLRTRASWRKASAAPPARTRR